jgi:Phytanoyl-CoA dioxygenase (PhyH)
MRGPLSILTTDKNFDNPWIGNPAANRLGLHVGRILLADGFDRLRWAMHRPLEQDRQHLETLRRDGVVAISNFLPSTEFSRLQAEVRGVVADSLNRFPPRDNAEPGFGAKEPFGGIGFDRFDGATLNRFITLDAVRTPETVAMVRSGRFTRFYRAAQGRSFPLNAVSLYYMRHGPETVHDIQKDFHRDTFHFTIKLWYFIEPAPPEAGPFIYVKGSNRSTKERLNWEYHRSLEAARGHAEVQGGSFRINEDELRAVGYPPPTVMAVPANTLVIADTHGFHRRGDAAPGTERVSIYGGMRRSPYWV